MKKLLYSTAFLFFSGAIAFAQTDNKEVPNIEVTGTARQEVTPDEIYVSITLRERAEGKDKISIEEQETQLKKGIQDVGIPLELLSLSDTESDYIRISLGKKDVITSKMFSLKLGDAETVGEIFAKLDELKIQDAYISRVDHSQIVELKKELRIKAIKAAKDKADYLLNAIGEETGHAIVVREQNNDYYNNYNFNRNMYANSIQTIVREEEEDISGSPEIQFQKIKLEASIYVKFEIKQ